MKARWYYILGGTALLGLGAIAYLVYDKQHKDEVEKSTSKNATSQAKENRNISFSKS